MSIRPLHLACIMGAYDAAKAMLDSGEEVSFGEGLISDVLVGISADASTKFKLVALLLSKGADPNHVNRKGLRPLESAVDFGCPRIIRLLILNGASVLFLANSKIKFTRLATLKALVKTGLKVTPRNDDWVSPLLFNAIRSQSLDTVAMMELLVAKEADVKVTADDDSTPLHAACGFNPDPDGGTCNFDDDELRFLLDHDADVDAVMKNGRTALHVLCEVDAAAGNTAPYYVEAMNERALECAKMLLSNGADVDLRDKEGKSPLDLAIANEKTDLAEMLEAHKESKKKYSFNYVCEANR